MQIIKINQWEDFVSLTNELDGWAFRGQRQAEWQLWSALSRHLNKFVPDSSVWAERESRAIRIFQRKAHTFVNDVNLLDDTIRCLALMQHHGGCTRLIDFSKSPYVAAFFALESANSESAVYAVNTPNLWRAVPRDYPELSRDEIDPREATSFERYFAPNKLPVVWTGEPPKLDRRLLAQSGTFVMPGQLDRPVEEIMGDQYQSEEPVIKKFVLDSAMRLPAMEALYRMNMTYATLFPTSMGWRALRLLSSRLSGKAFSPTPRSCTQKPRKNLRFCVNLFAATALLVLWKEFLPKFFGDIA